MRRFWMLFGLALLLFVAILPSASAKDGDDDSDDDDDDDYTYYEQSRDSLVEPLYLAVAMLAMVPLTIAAMAYKRTGHQRLLLLTVAFGLFALNGLVMSLEHRLGGYGITDEDVEFAAALIDFATIAVIAGTLFKK